MSEPAYKVVEKVRRLVAFAVLMENNDGILGKAPSYLLEKYELVWMLSCEALESLLDDNNRAKYREYLKRWRI